MDKLNSKQKKALIEKLAFFYNSDLDFLYDYHFYLFSKKNKIYISKINLDDLNLTKVSVIGLYFGTFHDEDRFRLSIEGSKLIIPKRNFVVLKKESFASYLAAENLFKEDLEYLNWEDNCPFLIVKYKDVNLGSVNVKDNQILNYVPKSRKLDYNKVF